MSLMKRIFSTESTGKRLSIAFLDTGISPVADFILPENRILAFRDFINRRTEPYDDNGHGTHVTASEERNYRIRYSALLLSFFPSPVPLPNKTQRRTAGQTQPQIHFAPHEAPLHPSVRKASLQWQAHQRY